MSIIKKITEQDWEDAGYDPAKRDVLMEAGREMAIAIFDALERGEEPWEWQQKLLASGITTVGAGYCIAKGMGYNKFRFFFGNTGMFLSSNIPGCRDSIRVGHGLTREEIRLACTMEYDELLEPLDEIDDCLRTSAVLAFVRGQRYAARKCMKAYVGLQRHRIEIIREHCSHRADTSDNSAISVS